MWITRQLVNKLIKSNKRPEFLFNFATLKVAAYSCLHSFQVMRTLSFLENNSCIVSILALGTGFSCKPLTFLSCLCVCLEKLGMYIDRFFAALVSLVGPSVPGFGVRPYGEHVPSG